MQIAGDRLRFKLQDAFQVLDRLKVKIVGRQTVKIADVLTGDDTPVSAEAEGGF